MTPDAIDISLATIGDADEILAVTRDAFRPVARQYGMTTLPPLEETLEQLRGLFATHVVLKAVEDGRIVGSVRAAMAGDTCEVGRLVVAPEAQGRGIGTALATALEARFPEARRFELFTGARSEASLHVYRGLGYVPFRIETVSPSLSLVYMEKLTRTPGR